MAISQHPFLERSQLANFQFVIAKGSSQQNIGLKFSEVDNVLKLKNWYMKVILMKSYKYMHQNGIKVMRISGAFGHFYL